MAWRASTTQAREAAERRLAGLARDWTRPPSEESAPWPVAEPRPRLQLGWGRPALRGGAILLVVLLLIVGYGVWLGRPRAVAEAPVALASGVALGLASPMAPPSPAPSAVTGEAAALAPVAGQPAPEVVVHVVGAVRRPGVVRLAAGSRVEDAVEAAGGVTRRRAADSVNLARVLVDGEQIVVSEEAAAQPPAAAGGAPAAPAVVDLNAASADALDALPGIGPVIAARIIAWRASNGPFRSIEELGEVSGIGDAILGQIRALVRV